MISSVIPSQKIPVVGPAYVPQTEDGIEGFPAGLLHPINGATSIGVGLKKYFQIALPPPQSRRRMNQRYLKSQEIFLWMRRRQNSCGSETTVSFHGSRSSCPPFQTGNELIQASPFENPQDNRSLIQAAHLIYGELKPHILFAPTTQKDSPTLFSASVMNNLSDCPSPLPFSSQAP